MTEKRKRKPRNKKITNYNKNKNKITIQIDNSKTTKGRAKKTTQSNTPYQQIVQIPQPYPIYQPNPLSLADVINSIQKYTQQEVKEMRPKKEMTLYDDEIPQLVIPELVKFNEDISSKNEYIATPIKKKDTGPVSPALGKEDELPIIQPPEQISLDDFLESAPEEIEKINKIIKDTDNKRREIIRKRENLREQLREAGANDLEIELIKNNVSKMEKLLKQYKTP
jgi:hypothetical protein